MCGLVSKDYAKEKVGRMDALTHGFGKLENTMKETGNGGILGIDFQKIPP